MKRQLAARLRSLDWAALAFILLLPPAWLEGFHQVLRLCGGAA